MPCQISAINCASSAMLTAFMSFHLLAPSKSMHLLLMLTKTAPQMCVTALCHSPSCSTPVKSCLVTSVLVMLSDCYVTVFFPSSGKFLNRAASRACACLLPLLHAAHHWRTQAQQLLQGPVPIQLLRQSSKLRCSTALSHRVCSMVWRSHQAAPQGSDLMMSS